MKIIIQSVKNGFLVRQDKDDDIPSNEMENFYIAKSAADLTVVINQLIEHFNVHEELDDALKLEVEVE